MAVYQQANAHHAEHHASPFSLPTREQIAGALFKLDQLHAGTDPDDAQAYWAKYQNNHEMRGVARSYQLADCVLALLSSESTTGKKEL